MIRLVVTGGGTGGHLYPGLAIARAVVALDAGVEPVFVGARRGIERDVLPTTEFRHELLDLHPFYRARPWENWRTVAGGLRAWRALGALFAREGPGAVLGTGGYAAGAALAYAVAHGVPAMLQEADSYPGATTRIVARRAAEVFLGFPEAAARLRPGPRTRVHAFGNPIEPPPPADARPSSGAAKRAWGFAPDAYVVLAFGGSQGARALNEALAGWVGDGVPDGVALLWATGNNQFGPYAAFDGASDGRVRVVPYLAPIARAYEAADLAVTRAGAMTIAELCAWGLPSVLVPLPTAAADHQSRNARTLAAAGAALHVRQSELGAARLGAIVAELRADPGRVATMRGAALARGRPDAAARIARRVVEVLRGQQRGGDRSDASFGAPVGLRSDATRAS
ncbi:UDP-N-acetylglucosamine--N-acetylmuramyl-(pentapeptide) pyrophosphoryl-undecaprenol N-acetylglucosamine transferase [Gemmatimonadetes bacterium T265]|nr:UDP-N-acetylglucosamine--N-acetylmuramyl-(pentapeptide) pyrophosphoryl-undecaprenol N-acetylglucosamine transferase [Gemmatimonadetes bacterium T265]